MAELTLDTARKILDAALAKGVEKKLKPLVVTILDARGAVKVTAAQDGTSLMRAEIAHGKAYGALALGMGSSGEVSNGGASSWIRPAERRTSCMRTESIARSATTSPVRNVPACLRRPSTRVVLP